MKRRCPEAKASQRPSHNHDLATGPCTLSSVVLVVSYSEIIFGRGVCTSLVFYAMYPQGCKYRLIGADIYIPEVRAGPLLELDCIPGMLGETD